jgi:hypothetical protein
MNIIRHLKTGQLTIYQAHILHDALGYDCPETFLYLLHSCIPLHQDLTEEAGRLDDRSTEVQSIQHM